MNLLWPDSLFLLGVIPSLLILYIWNLRRRRRFAVRYSSLALVRDVLPRYISRRQHIPFGLFLLAMASLGIAVGRPYTEVSVPSDQTVIMLALDVSRSMCSTDIAPSRLKAAEDAALAFTRLQKPTTQIGVVAFSGFAELIQSPTADPERLQSAIESLLLGSTTAIGSGILKSLDAIAEIDPNVFPSQPILSSSSDDVLTSTVTSQPDNLAADLPLQPDIIILLTDGVNNTGPQPLYAARQAAERGVRVYTIGFGTPNGSLYPDCPSNQVSSDPTRGFVSVEVDSYYFNHGLGGQFQDQEQSYIPVDGGSSSGGGFPRGIDEDTLKKVAAMTGGTYSSADSTSQLQQVLAQLPVARVMHWSINELSVVFTALGTFLAVLAIGLSIVWRPVE